MLSQGALLKLDQTTSAKIKATKPKMILNSIPKNLKSFLLSCDLINSESQYMNYLIQNQKLNYTSFLSKIKNF